MHIRISKIVIIVTNTRVWKKENLEVWTSKAIKDDVWWRGREDEGVRMEFAICASDQ